MRAGDIIGAWGMILQGRAPTVSIEITRECPLRCPGCYAYEDEHLGGGVTLRELADRKGSALVEGVMEVVERLRPLHLSLVGGDPLVRYRELEELLPRLLARNVHVQVVTSAFRPIPKHWANWERLTTSVSIDGLAPEHDVRRKPATYERILRNIEGGRITVHCTITAQMVDRPGYLDEFVQFWSARPEVQRIWFSLFTPQRGDFPAERLTAAQRATVIAEIHQLRLRYRKLEMPKALVDELSRPPASPDDCIFARTTQTISADLRTEVKPCQFGGNPDCSECGCMASMALAAVGHHRLGGLVPVGGIFRASAAFGSFIRRLRDKPEVRKAAPFPIID